MRRIVSFNRVPIAILIGVVLMPPFAAGQGAAYEPARLADGRPDLNGIWQALNEANWDLEPHAADHAVRSDLGAHFAVPPGVGVVEGGEIPYLPEARAHREANFESRLERDPEVKCYMPGVPRATYMPYPFQIIQSQDVIMIAYEFAGAVRIVNMGEPTEAPADSWMGWSNGRWDGDTLVVDVTAQVADTWFDRAGNYHTNANLGCHGYNATLLPFLHLLNTDHMPTFLKLV
jgi:hypothetical protein